MRQPRAKKFAWSLALILAGLTVWCLWATWETKRAAKQFFLEAQQVEIGRATAGQVLRLVHSTHRRTNGGFAPCQSGEGECSGTVFFDNIWLYRLHLAPAVVFACRFDIKNNKLQERWVEMVSSNDGRGERGTFVHEGNDTRFGGNIPRNSEEAYFRVSGGHPAGYLGIFITPQTPPDLRRIAYEFNFACLSKIGGCHLYEEMLPALARTDLYRGQNPWTHDVNPAE